MLDYSGMDKRTEIINAIGNQGLLPLYFHAEEEISIGALRALYEGGARIVEYTNRGKEALGNFKKLKAICEKEFKDLFLGAGTIKDEANATPFIDAGADFLVSPGLTDEVFDVSYSNKILWIPGCMTPSEIIRAEQFGIRLVKLFPGKILGPSFVSSIREIFPDTLFIPTGGVDLQEENLKSWFRAGVFAVGVGSNLIHFSQPEDEAFSRIRLATREALGLIARVRGQLKN